jgi:PrcB C-terminal
VPARGLGLVVLLGLLLGCRAEAPATGVTPPAPPSTVTIARGDGSRMTTPQALVVESPGDWQAVWARHDPATPPPAVDFATDVVVAIHAGRRPTAGYRVELVAVERRGSETVVAYRVDAPPPGEMVAQVITYPFHILRLPKPGTPLRLEQR